MRMLRALVPLVVTVGVLFEISRRVDVLEAFEHLHAGTLLVLLPALLLYAAFSLGVDAASLVRAGSAGGRRLSPSAMLRIKAASYPLALLHYALGRVRWWCCCGVGPGSRSPMRPASCC